jgi:hypothetical protein
VPRCFASRGPCHATLGQRRDATDVGGDWRYIARLPSSVARSAHSSRPLASSPVFFCLSSSPTIRFGSCLHFIPNPLGNDLISIGTLRTHPHNTTSPCVSPPPSPLPSRPLLALLLPPTSATPRSELATPSIGREVVC